MNKKNLSFTPKIENGISNYVNKINGEGEKYWGKVFDRFEATFYDESRVNEARKKFIKWGQTLAVAPSSEFTMDYLTRPTILK